MDEEQASQLKVKDFAARSKAKPQKIELVDLQSIIPMKESGLTLNQEITLSLSVRGFEESNPSFSNILRKYNEKMTGWVNSVELKNNFNVNPLKFFIGLRIVGKHVWQQQQEQKGDVSIVLM